MGIVVGIDAGTTGTKAAAVDAEAVIHAVGDADYPLRLPAPHRAELDPADLRDAAVRALADVAAQLTSGDQSPVAAVSLSAAMHGLVPFDAANRPCGPVVTWADTRADEQARWLRGRPEGAELHRRTGTPVHPMSPLVKLMWTAVHDPDLHRKARWGGVKEVLLASLVETELTVDLSCASATGLYDIHARRWDPQALELAGVGESQLPRVVPTTRVVGALRKDVARATGLPDGTPVIAGAADGTLANLGVGAIVPGCAALSVGTSGALRAVRATPGVDTDLRLFCYALTEDLWVHGGAVSNGASVMDWAAEAFGAPTDEHGATLLAEAAAVPPGSEGLLVLPYLLGERAPWWRSGMRGVMVGLRRDHGRGHLVRAAIEGVAQQLALIRQALAAAGVAVDEVRATGGALASPLWSSVLASALDLPLRQAHSSEDTAIGAALLGHHALGELSDLGQVAGRIALGPETAPDPEQVEVYRTLRPLVEQAVAALDDTFAALDALPRSLGGSS